MRLRGTSCLMVYVMESEEARYLKSGGFGFWVFGFWLRSSRRPAGDRPPRFAQNTVRPPGRRLKFPQDFQLSTFSCTTLPADLPRSKLSRTNKPCYHFGHAPSFSLPYLISPYIATYLHLSHINGVEDQSQKAKSLYPLVSMTTSKILETWDPLIIPRMRKVNNNNNLLGI